MRLIHLLLPPPQFACALGTLRPGGHFACKAFDLFTPFSAGLLYIMHRCFESVCVYAAAPTHRYRAPSDVHAAAATAPHSSCLATRRAW